MNYRLTELKVLTSVRIAVRFAWREVGDRSLFILGVLVFTGLVS